MRRSRWSCRTIERIDRSIESESKRKELTWASWSSACCRSWGTSVALRASTTGARSIQSAWMRWKDWCWKKHASSGWWFLEKKPIRPIRDERPVRVFTFRSMICFFMLIEREKPSSQRGISSWIDVASMSHRDTSSCSHSRLELIVCVCVQCVFIIFTTVARLFVVREKRTKSKTYLAKVSFSRVGWRVRHPLVRRQWSSFSASLSLSRTNIMTAAAAAANPFAEVRVNIVVVFSALFRWVNSIRWFVRS